MISLYLWRAGTYASYPEALRHTVFHVVSVGTTTGYATQDYAQWPPFAPLLMLLLGCFATCGGSTGGGIKMMRMLLLLKQAQHELVRIVHPNVVNPVVISGQVIPQRVMQNIIAFMMVYGATLVVLTMLLVFSGLDVVTAFTAVVACLNNIGPGLGEVGPARQLRRARRLPDLGLHLCHGAGPAGDAVAAGAVHAAVLERLTRPMCAQP